MRGRDVVRQRFQRLNSFSIGFPGLKQPWDSQKKLEWNAESVDYEGARRRSPTLSAFELFSCWLPRVEATLGWNSPTPLAFCFREKAFCFPAEAFCFREEAFCFPAEAFCFRQNRSRENLFAFTRRTTAFTRRITALSRRMTAFARRTTKSHCGMSFLEQAMSFAAESATEFGGGTNEIDQNLSGVRVLQTMTMRLKTKLLRSDLHVRQRK
jgi:hypothetical protein